jgi:hypothetical protein
MQLCRRRPQSPRRGVAKSEERLDRLRCPTSCHSALAVLPQCGCSRCCVFRLGSVLVASFPNFLRELIDETDKRIYDTIREYKITNPHINNFAWYNSKNTGRRSYRRTEHAQVRWRRPRTTPSSTPCSWADELGVRLRRVLLMLVDQRLVQTATQKLRLCRKA